MSCDSHQLHHEQGSHQLHHGQDSHQLHHGQDSHQLHHGQDSHQLHHGQAHMSEDEANCLIKKYDKNGDSILTKDELTTMILEQASQQQGVHKDIECKPQKVPPKIVEEKDVVCKPQKKPPKVPEEKEFKMKLSRSEIRDIFLEHDIDGDGCLTVSELAKAFNFMGSILSLPKAYHGLKCADADGDGRISEEELEKLIDYAEKVSKRKL